MKGLVIAGNYDQFRHYIGDNFKEYKYLGMLPEHLRGLSDTTLYLVGTYYMRPDYADFRNTILDYCYKHNITVSFDLPN